MFRIGRDGRGPITDLDDVDQLEPGIRAAEPGRYHIDEISADALPSGHTSRRWGVGIKRGDGSVMIEPDPWAD